MSFGNLVYSYDVYSHSEIQFILVAVKVSCHCCIVIVFNVKNVTLESVYGSIFSLSYIFDLALFAFQTNILDCYFDKCHF